MTSIASPLVCGAAIWPETMYVANDAISVFAVSAENAASSLRRCRTPFNIKLSGVLLLGVIDVNTELATQGPESDLAKMITSMLDVE